MATCDVGQWNGRISTHGTGWHEQPNLSEEERRPAGQPHAECPRPQHLRGVRAKASAPVGHSGTMHGHRQLSVGLPKPDLMPWRHHQPAVSNVCSLLERARPLKMSLCRSAPAFTSEAMWSDFSAAIVIALDTSRVCSEGAMVLIAILIIWPEDPDDVSAIGNGTGLPRSEQSCVVCGA